MVEEKVKLKGRVARDDWIAQASVLRGQNPYDPDEEVAHRPPPADQRAFFKPDRPADRAKEDRLNRVAMAEAIAENVFTVWKEAKEAAANKEADGVPLGENEIGYPGHPFIVHIAGRWGSGKSSILNFLREILERRTDETLDPPAGQTTTGYTKKNWVVIEFNAWRQQATGPAWWALMTAVRSGIGDQIGPRGDHFAWRDWFWRLRSTWRSWIIGAAVAAFVLFLSWALWPTAGQDDPKFNVVQILSTLAGAFASFVTINKFIGGFDARSERTAAAIQDLDIDPTEPLKQRFEEMIRDIHNPVAVFIDDLDRCDAAYVIELLQAIQTIYVDVPALYVVAADRDWIVSAYDQVYKDFKPEIDTPGQPLGYLFVKKIFQLSVNVPNLDDAYGRAFMKANLPGEAEEDALTEAEEKALQEEIANAPTLAAAERIVEAQTIPGSQRLAGRAIFRKAMTSEAQEELGHVLLDALTKDEMLIDLNPRAIKRLVNAYAFRWGFARSIGDRAIIPKLPYWCALDLRFPYAAERLMDNPDLRNDGAWQSDSEARFFPKRDHDAIGALLDHVDEADIRAFRALG